MEDDLEDDMEDNVDDQEESRSLTSKSVLYQQWKTTWKMMEDELEDD